MSISRQATSITRDEGSMNATHAPLEPVLQGEVRDATDRELAEQNWRYDHAWRILNLNQELIRAIDQKTYMLLVMSTLLVSFTANNIDRLSHEGWVRDLTPPLLGLSAIAFFIFSLATLLARHEPVSRADRRASLIFFNQVLTRESVETYFRDFHATGHREVVEDLLTQVMIVSSILRRKILNYHRTWWCLGLQVAVFLGLTIFGRLA